MTNSSKWMKYLFIVVALISTISIILIYKHHREPTPEEKEQMYIATFNENYDDFLYIQNYLCNKFDDVSDEKFQAEINLYLIKNMYIEMISQPKNTYEDINDQDLINCLKKIQELGVLHIYFYSAISKSYPDGRIITVKFTFRRKSGEGIVGSAGIAWLNKDIIPEQFPYYDVVSKKNWYYFEA